MLRTPTIVRQCSPRWQRQLRTTVGATRVNITVVDRETFRSVVVGLQIAHALRKLYPDQWETKRFNRLPSNQAVFDAIAAGQSPAALAPLYQPKLDAFLERRKEFLLYP